MRQDRRARVLVFAYACEPGRGSEPGAGWGLVRALADFADCVVLIGPEHTAAVRRWESGRTATGVSFVEVPEPKWAPFAKRHRVPFFSLYLAWLRAAGRVARRLHDATPFDAVCHATYAAYWLPTPATELGIPCVWGPVGGAVVTPPRLWPLLGVRGFGDELLDFISVRALASLPATRRTWRRAAVRIVQNEATRDRLPPRVRDGTLVLNHALFTELPEIAARTRGHKLLFVGALEARKGVKLALRAMTYTPADVCLQIVGDGPDRRKLERMARRLKLGDRVEFLGLQPRERVCGMLATAAAVVFTGLREEGGIALAEAMLSGAPVIVLAHGGARSIAAGAVDHARVALIEPGRVEVTARGFADAMTRFSRHPATAIGPTLDVAAARRTLQSLLERVARSGSPPGS